MIEVKEHPAADVIAAFVDGRLARDERRRIEAHLADCDVCREEVVAVTDLVGTRRPFRMPIAPLAAAAAVAVIALGVFNRTERPVEPVLRGDSIAPSLLANMPAPGSFAWHPVPQALEYRLTIMNSKGDVVGERVGADTTSSAPSLPAGEYRWYITAIRADGSVLSSRIHNFNIR